MLQIAVCDDDYRVYEHIRELICRYCIQHNREYKISYFDTAQALLSAPADYVALFLDIMLDNGHDGIAVGKELRKRGNNALFVMTTSRADRALESTGATIFRYLVKPLEAVSFFKVLDDMIEYLEYDKDVYVLKHNRQTEYITYKDILYFESYQRQRYVVTKTRVYTTTNTWKNHIEPVVGKRGFFTVNKTCVINLKHLTGHNANGVTMSNNKFIRLQSGKYTELMSALSDYFQMEG